MKKQKMPSRSAIAKMNREHAIKTIPEVVERIGKLQSKLSRMNFKRDRDIQCLVDLANMAGGQ